MRCDGGLSAAPWSGLRLPLAAVGWAALSGSVVYALVASMTRASSLLKIYGVLAAGMTLGMAAIALSAAMVEVSNGELVLRRRISPERRLRLADVVELVEITSTKGYFALRRIPGLTAITLGELAAETIVFWWGFSKSWPSPLALPAAVLAAVSLSSTSLTLLASPALGRVRGLGHRLRLAACLSSVAVAASSFIARVPPQSYSGEFPIVPACLGALGVAGLLLSGRRVPAHSAFKLRFSDGETLYVLALTEVDALKLREALSEAVANAETS